MAQPERNRMVNEHSLALVREWKQLGRAATAKELAPADPETRTVTALTSANVFVAAFQQAQDAKAYLVLRPPAAP